MEQYTNDQAFLEKYGPWALIVGASHGTGAACAHQLAARGLNCVLVARNATALGTLAEELSTQHGVSSKVIAADLSLDNSVASICSELDGIDIGLMVYNAGAPAYASTFLKAPLKTWQDLLALGASSLMEISHYVGQKLLARGRGGILLMGSHAALGGNKKYAMYTASKGFMLNFGESLWMELRDKNIDVLNFLIMVVDTPTLRKQMAESKIDGWDQDTIPGVYKPEDVVTVALRELPNGPTFIHPADEEDKAGLGAARRTDLIERWAHTAPYVGED